MTEQFDKQRQYVNTEFARMTTGKSYSNSKKTKILKALWKKAKRKY